MSWARLLKRVFDIDIEHCSNCGGSLKIIAAIEDPPRNDVESRAAIGLVAAMSLYNSAAVVLLALAGIGSGPVGFAWWPAVVLHATLAVWCIACLRSKSVARGQETRGGFSVQVSGSEVFPDT